MKCFGAIAFDIFFLVLLTSGLQESIALPLPPHLIKGGNWQFLTHISLLLTIIYVGLNLFSINRKLLKNFHHLCANLEFLVTVAYWGMKFFYPQMLNGDSFAVSLGLDLKIHLFPYIYMLLDGKDHISFKRSAMFSAVAISLYWGYVEYLYWCNSGDGVSRFSYPFMGNGLRPQWMFGFFAVSTVNWIVEQVFH